MQKADHNPFASLPPSHQIVQPQLQPGINGPVRMQGKYQKLRLAGCQADISHWIPCEFLQAAPGESRLAIRPESCDQIVAELDCACFSGSIFIDHHG
jgi:hypothetical protein